MLYKKANWLLTSAVGQTGQWSAALRVPCQSRSLDAILIFVKRLKLSFAQEIQKMNGEEISKIQIEQYQKPSFYFRRCDSHFMSHTKGNQPYVLSENL